MKVVIVKLLIIFFVTRTGAAEDHQCTLVDDFYGKNLHESVCYLSCLSNALSKLYTDGEQRMLVSEEVYANASRILDDMEGKTGESVKYLSVISGVMEGKHDKLEKLISYGNEMGDLVAKVGGLFSDVNESVRAVRKKLPDALMKANKYYTSVAEVVRTVWDDVKGLGVEGKPECGNEKIVGVKDFQVTCSERACPLKEGVNDSVLRKYEDGCVDINVLNGSVSKCLNVPRYNLYKNGAVNESKDGTNWYAPTADLFQFKVEVNEIFPPLILPLPSGLPPSALLATISNITSYYTHFNKVHANFTSLLIDADLTDNVNSTNFTI
ncbi:ESAG protein, putative [Trypanosoma equiperdum]|uniref:ESAG protein, putative n=1 Tax=Trypanosoma equiperdum TaxID=5694 RepID=A0A1G4ID64_TRYEQ|nr:ESAG protein, putative [Trypanosoma equiperdum]